MNETTKDGAGSTFETKLLDVLERIAKALAYMTADLERIAINSDPE